MHMCTSGVKYLLVSVIKLEIDDLDSVRPCKEHKQRREAVFVPDCSQLTASYPGLLTPAFVTCSTNAEEGLVKLSHVV